MDLLLSTQQRVRALLAEIDRLLELDFPYRHSEEALRRLRDLTGKSFDRLLAVMGNEPDVVLEACRSAVRDISSFLPLVGFVVSSTSGSNAFELFGPFLRLAGDVLEPNVPQKARATRLLLLSEWDYSTTVYSVRALPSFVLIGFPAPESGNPLLIPLAGHELGHTVWWNNAFADKFRDKARQAVVSEIHATWPEYQEMFPKINIPRESLATDLDAVESYRRATQWCLAQAKESFCDFLGLRLFGPSYLHAFAYLLSPGFGNRTEEYPDMVNRVRHLLYACDKYQIEAPAEYERLFDRDDVLIPPSSSDFYLLMVADRALRRLLDPLIHEVERLVEAADVRLSTAEGVDRVLKRFRHVTPAEQCTTISDILNAAWVAYGDDALWSEFSELKEKRNSVLKEVVLKSLEVFEIERIEAE